jgi:hypothetical protein
MRYYILYPGSSINDLVRDDHQLGEDTGFGVFWAADGFRILQKAIVEDHDTIKNFTIVNDRGGYMLIEEFLDAIAKLKIRQN